MNDNSGGPAGSGAVPHLAFDEARVFLPEYVLDGGMYFGNRLNRRKPDLRERRTQEGTA